MLGGLGNSGRTLVGKGVDTRGGGCGRRRTGPESSGAMESISVVSVTMESTLMLISQLGAFSRMPCLKMKPAMSEFGLMQVDTTPVSIPPAPVAASTANALFQSGRL